MESFELHLKNDKIRSYKRIVYMVATMSVVFFLFYSIYSNVGHQRIIWMLVSLVAAAVCIAEAKIGKINGKNTFGVSVTYIVLIICWMFINIWMAIANLILLLADSVARRSLPVLIDTNGIAYPSFPKKEIKWADLENVILKDGLLTIDFKNNHLLQAEIRSSENDIDEMAFNIFCKKQLNKQY